MNTPWPPLQQEPWPPFEADPSDVANFCQPYDTATHFGDLNIDPHEAPPQIARMYSWPSTDYSLVYTEEPIIPGEMSFQPIDCTWYRSWSELKRKCTDRNK